ncbi:hypothetical protein [Spirillospora sp. CA-294931]|uniref:hypothetical protein n=1 Tax=Spirillospora sp. CA-294931 TaxID=3240042 RepID=UPI003D943423
MEVLFASVRDAGVSSAEDLRRHQFMVAMLASARPGTGRLLSISALLGGGRLPSLRLPAERQALGHIQPHLAVGLDVLPEQGSGRVGRRA